MKESPLGFQYSWEDTAPVRPLFIVTICGQFVGGTIGYWLALSWTSYYDILNGAVLGTFPGYLLGLIIQRILRPGSLSANRVIVRRMGLVALALSVPGLYVLLRV